MGSSYTPGRSRLPLTQTSIPIGTPENDMGNARQGFGIIDDRGTAPEPYHGGKGGADARNAPFTFERFHQRRFLAYLVCASAAMPVDVEIVAAAENVFTQKAAGVGIFERLLHDYRSVPVFTANIDVPGACSHRESGDHHAFDHRVRIMLENE